MEVVDQQETLPRQRHGHPVGVQHPQNPASYVERLYLSHYAEESEHADARLNRRRRQMAPLLQDLHGYGLSREPASYQASNQYLLGFELRWWDESKCLLLCCAADRWYWKVDSSSSIDRSSVWLVIDRCGLRNRACDDELEVD